MPLHHAKGLGKILCAKDVELKGEIWEVACFHNKGIQQLAYSISNVAYSCNIIVKMHEDEFQQLCKGTKCDKVKIPDLSIQCSKSIDYLALTGEANPETGLPVAELRLLDEKEEKRINREKKLSVDAKTASNLFPPASDCEDLETSVTPMLSIECGSPDEPNSFGEQAVAGAGFVVPPPSDVSAMQYRASMAQEAVAGLGRKSKSNNKLCLVAQKQDSSEEEEDAPTADEEAFIDLSKYSRLRDKNKWRGQGKSWGLAFRRSSPETMLKWQQNPITEPMTMVAPHETQAALQISVLLQKFCDDKQRILLDPMKQIREIVDIAKQSPELTEELYVQMLKQTNGNPFPRKTFFMFQGMLLGIQLLPPSKELSNFMRSKVSMALRRAGDSHDKRPYTMFLEDLEKVMNPPAPVTANEFFIQVGLFDGTAKIVWVNKQVTVKHLCETIIKELGLSSEFNWTLFQSSSVARNQRPLPEVSEIGEIYSIWEECACRPCDRWWFVLKRVCMNAKEKIPTTMPEDLHYSYMQACSEFRDMPNCGDDTAILLAISSYMLYVETHLYKEEVKDTKNGSLEAEGVLETFAPYQSLKGLDRKALSARILKAHAIHKSESRTVAYATVYRWMQRLKMFGCFIRKGKQTLENGEEGKESKFVSMPLIIEKRRLKKEKDGIKEKKYSTSGINSLALSMNIPPVGMMPITSVVGADLITTGLNTNLAEDAVRPTTTDESSSTTTDFQTKSEKDFEEVKRFESNDKKRPSAMIEYKQDRTMDYFKLPRWAQTGKGAGSNKSTPLSQPTGDLAEDTPPIDSIANIVSVSQLTKAAENVRHFIVNPEHGEEEYWVILDAYGIRLVESESHVQYGFQFHDKTTDHLVAWGQQGNILKLVCGIVSKRNGNGELETRPVPLERKIHLSMPTVSDVAFMIHHLHMRKIFDDEKKVEILLKGGLKINIA